MCIDSIRRSAKWRTRSERILRFFVDNSQPDFHLKNAFTISIPASRSNLITVAEIYRISSFVSGTSRVKWTSRIMSLVVVSRRALLYCACASTLTFSQSYQSLFRSKLSFKCTRNETVYVLRLHPKLKFVMISFSNYNSTSLFSHLLFHLPRYLRVNGTRACRKGVFLMEALTGLSLFRGDEFQKRWTVVKNCLFFIFVDLLARTIHSSFFTVAETPTNAEYALFKNWNNFLSSFTITLICRKISCQSCFSHIFNNGVAKITTCLFVDIVPTTEKLFVY